MPITIEHLQAQVDADPASAIAALEALSVVVDRTARDRHANITLDVDDSAADRATGVFDALGFSMDRAGQSADRNRASISGLSLAAHTTSGAMQGLSMAVSGIQFGALYSGATMASGALGGLAAAAAGAVGAIGPLIGLLGAIPVGLGAIVGGLGSTLLGFSGVGAAVKAMDVAVGGAGASMNQAQSNARALRDANYGLRDATEAVADAERGLADAQRGVIDAQKALREATEDIADARRDAAEDIRDLGRAAEDAAFRELDAVDRLRRAQENLTKAQSKTARSSAVLSKETDEFTGKVYEVSRVTADAVDSAGNEADAKREVERAERELKRAREDNIDAANRYNEAQRAGIEGSDRVQAALKREEQATRGVEAAIRRVADAQRALRKAHENVARAQERVADASKKMAAGAAAGGAGFSALAKAMDNLSPAGKRFAKFLHDEFLPAMKEIRFAAQEGLLPGVEKGLRSFLTVLPLVKKHVFNFAKAVGDSFADLMAHLVTPEMVAKIDTMFTGMFEVLAGSTDAAGNHLNGLLDVLIPIADIFVAITNAATPMTKLLTNDLVTGLTNLSDRMSTVEGHKSMVGFFADAYKFSRLWWNALKPLAQILWDVSTAARPLAEWMLKGMATELERVHKWTSSFEGQNAMKDWFESMKPAIRETVGLLGDLAKVLFFSSEGGEDSAYVSAVKAMREYIVPALGDLMKALDKSDFGPKFMKFIGNVIWGIEQLVKHDGILVKIMDTLNGAFDFFKRLDAVTGGASTTGILGLITALAGLKVVKVVIGFFKPLLPVLKFVGGLFKNLWKVLEPLVTRLFPKFLPWINRMRLAFVVFTGPIGIAAAVIGALVLAFVALWNKSDAFREFWIGLWDDVKTAAVDVWNNYIKPAWAEIMSFLELELMPMFWRLYNEVILPVWGYIKDEIVGAWNEHIKPALEEFGRFLDEDLGPKIDYLWTEVIQPVFKEIGSFIAWTWSNVIKPAFDIWIFYLKNVLGPVIKFLWENVVKPAFEFIGWQIGTTWKIIKPIFEAWWSLMKAGFGLISWLYNNIVKPYFKLIGGAISDTWKNIVKPALDAFQSAFDKTGSRASALKSAFETAWKGIKDTFRSNINTIIRWWNKLHFTVPKIDMGPIQLGGGTISLPPIAELRQFGGMVKGGQSYIVGEKRPEMLTLPSGSNGRLAAAVPRPMESTGGGITAEQLDRILNKVLEKAKPNVDLRVDQHEHADPKAISRELAWSLR